MKNKGLKAFGAFVLIGCIIMIVQVVKEKELVNEIGAIVITAIAIFVNYKFWTKA